jgi:hypothetical protein
MSAVGTNIVGGRVGIPPENVDINGEKCCILRPFGDFLYFKGIGSILFLKNGFKKNCRKNYKSNNYEVCTAVALCFPNILDVMVLENIYSDTKYEMVGENTSLQLMHYDVTM